MNIKSTLIKIVLSIVVFIGSSMIIAVMQQAHVFGKFLVVGVLLVILKLIWSGGKENSSNSTTVSSNPQPKEKVTTSKPDIKYDGGHNAQQGNNYSNSQTSVKTKPTNPVSNTITKDNKGFSGTNPYSKN